MKTTLNLDDALMRALKREAAVQGRTMTSLVEEALRELLRRDSSEVTPPAFRWPTFRGGRPPTVDVADRDALYDLMDAGP